MKSFVDVLGNSFRKGAKNVGTSADETTYWQSVATAYRQHMPDMTREVGDAIGDRFEVQEVLGANSLFETYVVTANDDRSTVVLKTFRNEFLRDRSARRQFLKDVDRWARTAAHPNVARAFGVEVVGPRAYVVVEHVAPSELGIGSLEQFLDRRAATPEQAIRWGIQISRGMAHLRANGIRVHGDLKPSKVLLTVDGTARIIDPGLTRMVDAARALPPVRVAHDGQRVRFSHQKVDGSGHGTPSHMAPEQFTNAERIDERADVYSFGVILYQLITGGQVPFQAPLPETDGDAVARARREMRYWRMMAAQHGREPVPTVDSPLFPIVERCLEKNPADRFQSFREVGQALETLLRELVGPDAVEVESTNSTCVEATNRAATLMHQRRYDDALVVLGEALSQNPRYAPAWCVAATAQRLRGDHAEALRCADKAIANQPTGAEAWNERGLALDALGRVDEAIASYDRAVALDPRSVTAWNNRGVAHLAAGETASALAIFNQALEIDRQSPTLWRNRGVALYKLGQHDAAGRAFERCLDLNPDDRAALSYRGLASLELGDTEAALAAFDRALAIDPTDAVAWHNRGHVLSLLGRDADAAESFERALAIDADLPTTWLNRGLANSRLGRFDEAIACFNEALARDATIAEAWSAKGLSLDVLGQFHEAVACFDRAIEIAPEQAAIWNNRGLSLDALARHNEAIECYTRALALDPQLAEAWNNQGLSLANLARYPEAIVAFERAVRLDPSSPIAWANKGASLGAIGRADEAIACSDRALALDPTNPATWRNKGWYLTDLGEYAAAIECYDRAIELDADDPRTWFEKAFAEAQLGRDNDAAVSYARHLALAESYAGTFTLHTRQRTRELAATTRVTTGAAELAQAA